MIIGIVVFINLIALGASFAVILKKEKEFVSASDAETARLKGSIKENKETLVALYQYARKTISEADLKELRKSSQKLEGTLAKKKSKQAELDERSKTLQAKLSDLAELESELETSEAQAREELLMLQDETKRMAAENEELLNRLEDALKKVESLMKSLEQSQESVDKLNSAKAEMLESQSKIEFYESDIQEVSQNIIDLKSAYDALDIEYAQLYEKQVL